MEEHRAPIKYVSNAALTNDSRARLYVGLNRPLKVLRWSLMVTQLLTLMGLKFTHQSRRYEGLNLLSMSYIDTSASSTERTNWLSWRSALSEERTFLYKAWRHSDIPIRSVAIQSNWKPERKTDRNFTPGYAPLRINCWRMWKQKTHHAEKWGGGHDKVFWPILILWLTIGLA